MSCKSWPILPLPTNKESKSSWTNYKLSKHFKDIAIQSLWFVLKMGIIVALFAIDIPKAIPISLFILATAAADWTILYFSKKYPLYQTYFMLGYVINSLSTLTIVLLETGWLFNDFYLVFVISIAFTTLIYGYKAGLISYLLFHLIYTAILINYQAPSAGKNQCIVHS